MTTTITRRTELAHRTSDGLHVYLFAESPLAREVGDERRRPADLEALIRKAEKLRECAQCGKHLDHRERPRSAYCSEKCRVVFRRRRRVAAMNFSLPMF